MVAGSKGKRGAGRREHGVKKEETDSCTFDPRADPSWCAHAVHSLTHHLTFAPLSRLPPSSLRSLVLFNQITTADHSRSNPRGSSPRTNQPPSLHRVHQPQPTATPFPTSPPALPRATVPRPEKCLYKSPHSLPHCHKTSELQPLVLPIIHPSNPRAGLGARYAYTLRRHLGSFPPALARECLALFSRRIANTCQP